MTCPWLYCEREAKLEVGPRYLVLSSRDLSTVPYLVDMLLPPCNLEGAVGSSSWMVHLSDRIYTIIALTFSRSFPVLYMHFFHLILTKSYVISTIIAPFYRWENNYKEVRDFSTSWKYSLTSLDITESRMPDGVGGVTCSSYNLRIWVVASNALLSVPTLQTEVSQSSFLRVG